MINIFFRYSLASFILIILGVLLIDGFFLPVYVGAGDDIYLPDVREKFQNKATRELSKLGFEIKIITVPYIEKKAGKVIEMFPRAYTKVKKGREITITIGGHEKDVIVPDLTNMTLRKAKIEISDLGLNLDTLLMYEFNTEVKSGNVAFQVPSKGAIRKSGQSVTLGISKGSPPDYYVIPDLINYSLKKAKGKIEMEGLRLGQIHYEYQPNLLNNTVIDQAYPAGLKVTNSLEINLTVSKDHNEE